MADIYYYPSNVFELLVETISRLVRSKKAVFLFLQSVGVAQEDLRDVDSVLSKNQASINKFEIVCSVLTKVNSRGDSGLRARREIIKRVVSSKALKHVGKMIDLKQKD